MTFLALDIQRNFLVLQQSQLEYQSICYSSDLNLVTQRLSALSAADPNGNAINTAAGRSLQALQQMYTQCQASIESQLKAIRAQKESYDKVVADEIKSGCKLFSLA